MKRSETVFLQKKQMAKLYLIPNVLSDNDWQLVLPAVVPELISNIKHYVVENIRTTRRFLKQIDRNIDIDSLTFFELNKHSDKTQISEYLIPLEQGEDIAVISEAGCPGVADPGAGIVRIAHQKGLKVVPVVGPSSILLALMASGLNGQNFAFNGYLPVKHPERKRAISALEKIVMTEGQTQIVIETPYRNNALIDDLIKTCAPSTLLCIACNLTAENEFILTQPINEWRKQKPDINKQPSIFLLGR